jgi:hypothetical protein
MSAVVEVERSPGTFFRCGEDEVAEVLAKGFGTSVIDVCAHTVTACIQRALKYGSRMVASSRVDQTSGRIISGQ